ncbi:hypothetical protein ABZ614_20660 [Streptomyces sp. NPDC013178]|uniref:hypothetical protein n=1 Tax=Streptomyces sp. NPDC013178 TaxID=3155118 RepID=UPI0034045FEE
MLREVFDYPYPRVSELLRLSQANVRQIVSRSRRRLGTDRRAPVDRAQHRRLLAAFVAAARAGDIGPLAELLRADAVSYSGGNGAGRVRPPSGPGPRHRAARGRTGARPASEPAGRASSGAGQAQDGEADPQVQIAEARLAARCLGGHLLRGTHQL